MLFLPFWPVKFTNEMNAPRYAIARINKERQKPNDSVVDVRTTTAETIFVSREKKRFLFRLSLSTPNMFRQTRSLWNVAIASRPIVNCGFGRPTCSPPRCTIRRVRTAPRLGAPNHSEFNAKCRRKVFSRQFSSFSARVW